MEYTNELFLKILGSALRGEAFTPAEPVSPEQWQALFRLAAIHKVEPLILEAIHASIASEPALAMALKRQVRQQVILQAMRTADFLALNEQLRAAGVRTIVVKGIACRSLYPNPDHRPSSDEDVLVEPGSFDACREVFLRFGLETELTEQEQQDTYEIPWRKKGSALYIELHKELFPAGSGAYGDLNRFFEGVFDRAAEVTACGGTVTTMEPTDHMLYLICHAYKHFLHSGFGIRQVCDMALFANRYGARIDWDRILECCQAIRAERFAAALFAIAEKHLTFDPGLACWPDSWRAIEVDAGALLLDILCAGIYGGAEASRQHSSNVTLDAVAAEKEGRRARGAVLASVFPSAKKLEGRYPWLKAHPWLLPAAWAGRLVTYARETAATESGGAADALKLGGERVELLRRYGIIK